MRNRPKNNGLSMAIIGRGPAIDPVTMQALIAAGATALFFVAGLAAMLWAASAHATEIHYHGFQMDSQNKLIFEQEAGLVRVTVVSRTRPIGIEPDQEAPSPEEALLGRNTKRRELAWVRADVLKPSAPNYLRNPGQRYRITIEGVEVCPEYATIVEADAADARKTMQREIKKLEARSTGVDRQALGYAVTMVPDILNQADRMPAALSDTVLRSQVGRIRVSPKTLQRQTLPTGAPETAVGLKAPQGPGAPEGGPPQGVSEKPLPGDRP